MRRNLLLLVAGCFAFVLGCNDSKPTASSPAFVSGPLQGEAPAGKYAERAEFAFHKGGEQPAAGAVPPNMPGMAVPANAPPPVEAPAKRRIIYTASIDLIVNDFDESGKKLHQIVDEREGFVSKSDVGILEGERRRATWTLRVPVAKFRETMDAIAGIGHAISTRHDSQDVTDEFYDLEARLKNKRVEEERLVEHLKKSTGKLEDILTVEREISRVRGEIESTQGRLQKLSKLSELTTITVTMQERKDYVPPTAPNYTTSMGRTFGSSVEAMSDLFKAIGLAIAAIVPWSPLILVGAVSIWLARRRWRKSLPTP